MLPPIMAAQLNGWPVRIQSARATRNIVSSAATDDKTGEVSEMRTRKQPLKTALDRTATRINQQVEAAGISKRSMLRKCRKGRGIQRTVRVKKPMQLPNTLAKMVPRTGETPSGGQA